MREIERMSVAELKESALALLSEGGPEYAAPEAYIREKIIRVLLEELFLREGIRSLQWADALEYPGARAKALEDLVGHLAETDPATSREWMDRMRIELGENAYRRWLARACRGAAGRSAADLVDLTRLFGRDCYHLLTTSGPFADDFDFKTFWSGCLENGVALHQIEPATAMFASQDRDAAISTIGRLRADGSGTLSHSGSMDELMKGVLLSHGRKDATAWLIGKLDQLGETARVEAVQALYQREDLDDLAALESVCRVLPTAGDRVALIARATEHGAGNAADALRLLASDSERADALTETLGQRYDFKISLERVAEIERLMDETGMSETARASVRAHWENE
ncbi:MAG: hypothetical protein J0M04_07950 [Verrucomicrobia bacterium]|nr:hypothetical protein [Verrucomicrobiota bacterium]